MITVRFWENAHDPRERKYMYKKRLSGTRKIRMMVIMENKSYRWLHGVYWLSFSVCHGYITYYLTRFGFTPAQVGLLASAFGILAAFTQVVLGKLADRSPRWNWKRLIMLCSVIGMVSMIAALFGGYKWLVGGAYGIFMVCDHAMLPLVNSACFYYRSRGIDVSFGPARGIGSLSYAVFSFVMGYLTAWFGTVPVALLGAADMAAIWVVAARMPLYDGPDAAAAGQAGEKECAGQKDCAGEKDPAGGKDRAAKDPLSGIIAFVRRYPSFMMIIAGLTLLMTFHNVAATYMLQIVENVGGDNRHLGTALSLCAFFELPVMFGYSRLSKRFKPETMLKICGVMYIVRAWILLSASGIAGIYAAQMSQIFTFALYASASVYYTDRAVSKEDAVTGQAVMSDVETVGAVIGSFAGGQLLQAGGVPLMLRVSVAIAAAGAVFILLSGRFRNHPGTAGSTSE